MSEPAATVDEVGSLDDATEAEVRRLAEAAERADGDSPLDDQVRLDLAHGSATERLHLLARRPAPDGSEAPLAGYGHLDLRTPGAATAHLVVEPGSRRAGVGSLLVEHLDSLAADRDLSAWAHGDGEPARAFADRLGWTRTRELRQMRLLADTPIGEAVIAEGVTVRAFEPGADEAAWVAVNAEAFSGHPEQGRMTVDDLLQREEQPWFDPAGFFVAERDDEVIGFHWTKIHDDGEQPVGEVYVVGVAPAAQGLGLGKALTLVGLHHLRARGLDVILYVDADNTAAVALYQRLGFTVTKVDVMYTRPSPTA